FIQGLPQFLPGGLKLSRGPHVSKLIQARKLQQNVQASNEPACRRSSFLAHSSTERPPSIPSPCLHQDAIPFETSILAAAVTFSLMDVTFQAQLLLRPIMPLYGVAHV